MPSREMLTLGLLPERKRNWRTFVVSYTGCAIIVMMLLCIHLIWPDRMSTWAKYTVTEIIPRPDFRSELAHLCRQLHRLRDHCDDAVVHPLDLARPHEHLGKVHGHRNHSPAGSRS